VSTTSHMCVTCLEIKSPETPEGYASTPDLARYHWEEGRIRLCDIVTEHLCYIHMLRIAS